MFFLSLIGSLAPLNKKIAKRRSNHCFWYFSRGRKCLNDMQQSYIFCRTVAPKNRSRLTNVAILVARQQISATDKNNFKVHQRGNLTSHPFYIVLRSPFYSVLTYVDTAH